MVLASKKGHLTAIELTEKIAVDSVVLLAPSFFTSDERFATRTPVSAWLLPDIIFRTFNTAICVPYSNHSLSIAANLGLWQELQWLLLLPKFCLHPQYAPPYFREPVL